MLKLVTCEGSGGGKRLKVFLSRSKPACAAALPSTVTYGSLVWPRKFSRKKRPLLSGDHLGLLARVSLTSDSELLSSRPAPPAAGMIQTCVSSATLSIVVTSRFVAVYAIHL